MELRIKKTKAKLRSKAGETIAEVLIALLISSLALVMLASMISATQSMIDKSKIKLEKYYQKNEELETFLGTATEDSVKITDTAAGITIAVPVNEYLNSEFGDSRSVYVYTIQGTP